MTAMNENVVEYVTAMIGGQLFGLPISRVQDVFVPERLTRVPLAGAGYRGSAQSARPHRHRDRHAAPARPRGARARRPADGDRRRARSESYGLLIDEIGEVLKLPAASREDNPVNLDERLARVSAGVHRLEGRLLVVLDVERVLDAGAPRQPREAVRRECES